MGLVGALIGAAAGYLGAVRSAARSNRPAWTSAALDAARSLLASDDPAVRAQGSRLLQAAAAAIGADPDAPGQIREVTRNGPSRRSAVADSASDPALVRARALDAARVEVDAFRAARLSPDPAVLRLAEAGTGPADGSEHPSDRSVYPTRSTS